MGKFRIRASLIFLKRFLIEIRFLNKNRDPIMRS
jgi:hypothetical protein